MSRERGPDARSADPKFPNLLHWRMHQAPDLSYGFGGGPEGAGEVGHDERPKCCHDPTGSRVENERQPEEHCHKSKWNPEVEIAN